MSASAAKIRVLVVDRDPALRRGLGRRLGEHPYVQVVGAAADRAGALSRLASAQPDWLVVDLVEDADDGLALLGDLQAHGSQVRPAVVTQWGGLAGAAVVAKAQAAGAAAVVARQAHLRGDAMVEQLGADLLAPMLRAEQVGRRAGRRVPPQVVGVGVSTGGPVALNALLRGLPADFPTPIVVVQHMPPEFTASLARSLDQVCALRVREAAGGEALQPGDVWIAPGGRHLRVHREGGRATLEVTEDPPEQSCRPSVDYLFRSLADGYGAGCVGVVLTGMGEDGWLGARAVHVAGGDVLAQDRESAAVYGMPRGPIEAGIARAVPLDGMAEAVLAKVRATR